MCRKQAAHGVCLLLKTIKDERLIGQRVCDTDRQVSGQQVIDDLAHHFRSPSASQQGQFALFEAAEPHPISDQVADILSRPRQAGRDLRAAADAP